MARMTYDEFLKESQQTLNYCICVKGIINDFVKDIKNYQRLNGHDLYARGVVKVVESYANLLCYYLSIVYSEYTSDFFDAQKRHVQRLIKKEVIDADTSK